MAKKNKEKKVEEPKPEKVEKKEKTVEIKGDLKTQVKTLMEKVAGKDKEVADLKRALANALKKVDKPESSLVSLQEKVDGMSEKERDAREKELRESIGKARPDLDQYVHRGGQFGRIWDEFWGSHKNEIREWQMIRRKQHPEDKNAANWEMNITPLKKEEAVNG
jgi:chromosome segregation ATPase